MAGDRPQWLIALGKALGSTMVEYETATGSRTKRLGAAVRAAIPNHTYSRVSCTTTRFTVMIKQVYQDGTARALWLIVVPADRMILLRMAYAPQERAIYDGPRAYIDDVVGRCAELAHFTLCSTPKARRAMIKNISLRCYTAGTMARDMQERAKAGVLNGVGDGWEELVWHYTRP